MGKSLILEIKKLRKNIYHYIENMESTTKINFVQIDEIESVLEGLKSLEKEQYLPDRSIDKHFLSDSYIYRWAQSIRKAGENKSVNEISFLLQEMWQYLELPDLLLRYFMSGTAYAGIALKIFEYCYCIEKSPEVLELAKKIMEAREVITFPVFLDVKEDFWKPEVGYDDNFGLYYMIDPINSPDFPLYLKKSCASLEEAKRYALQIMKEQDERSPHRYFNKRMEVPEGAVLIDAGVAEGNFTAACIDRVSKVYLVECDPEWMECLKISFRNYLDKIVFVNKFLGSYDDETTITIDSMLNGSSADYIKMDIEGAELSALNGAEYTLAYSKEIKCNICVYHRLYDNEMIKSLLESYGFFCENTKGYMCFQGDIEFPLCPRRGLLQAVKGRR